MIQLSQSLPGRNLKGYALLALFFLTLVACSPETAAANLPPTVSPVPSPSATDTRVLPTATRTRVPSTETPIPPKRTLYIAPELASSLRATIQQAAQEQKLELVDSPDGAGVVIGTQPSPDPLLLTEQVFAVADRFATLRDEVSLQQLKQVWSGQPVPSIAALFVTDDTANMLASLLGTPGATVQRVTPEELVNRIWQTADALAIVPFDRLEPRLHALSVDGQNLLDAKLDMTTYPLVIHAYLKGDPELAMSFYNALRDRIEPTNRDPKRMTTIVMTGVTAMGRFTADAIDKSGDPAFPARVVAPILAQADITHVSNEIPFVENCPPNLVHDSIVLCSKPEYIETFKLMGVDIVGLTGNHAGDFGYDNYVKTLELYEKNGIKHYAGGRNEAEARKPLIIEHNGNTIAFLGANSFGPQSYWATPNKPGSNGYDAAKMKQDITEARRVAELVFVEYQADEVYQYKPDATNVQIFTRTIEDGADVVTGVQNHHPAAVEFQDDGKKEILYGLGNFSFDQMYDEEVRQGLIPRHTVYKGKLLQTELLTTMLDYYAQPRWATLPEREKILRAVFTASGFKVQ